MYHIKFNAPYIMNLILNIKVNATIIIFQFNFSTHYGID